MDEASSDAAAGATAAYHGILSRGLPSTSVPRLQLRPRQVPNPSAMRADGAVDGPGCREALMRSARQPCVARNGVAAEVRHTAQMPVATRLVAPRSKEEVTLLSQLYELQRRVVDFRSAKDIASEMQTRRAILECCVQLGDVDQTLKEAKAASERSKGSVLEGDMAEVIRSALCSLAKLQEGADGSAHGPADIRGLVQQGPSKLVSAEAAVEVKQLKRQVVDCRSSGDFNAEFQARKRIVHLCASVDDVEHALSEARWASKRAWAAGDLDKIIKARELLSWTQNEASRCDRSRSQHRLEAADRKVIECASPQRYRGATPPPAKLRSRQDDDDKVFRGRLVIQEPLTPEAPSTKRWQYPVLPFTPTPIKSEGPEPYRLLQALEQVVVSEVFQLQAFLLQQSLNPSRRPGWAHMKCDATWLRTFAFEALEACKTLVDTSVLRQRAPDALRREWRLLDAAGKQEDKACELHREMPKMQQRCSIWSKAAKQNTLASGAPSRQERATQGSGAQRQLEALSAILRRVDEDVDCIEQRVKLLRPSIEG